LKIKVDGNGIGTKHLKKFQEEAENVKFMDK